MIRPILMRLLKVFWLLPGFLLWAAFPPMGERSDVLFALAPLLWLTRRADVRTNLRRWFANGFLFWFLTLAWMPAIVKNGGPWPLVVLGWVGLSAYCALYFVAYGYLATKAWELVRVHGYVFRLLALLIVEPVLWAGLELVRSRLLGGFAWNQLGVVAVNTGFGAPAALGGVYLLSMVVILINGTFASIAERILPRFGMMSEASTPRWTRSVETLLPFLLVFAIFRTAERFCVEGGEVTRGGRKLSVALVQRNFPCVFKDQEERPILVYSNLLANVSSLRPDLIVLPESAMCEFGRLERANARHFADFVLRQTGARALLAGGTRVASAANGVDAELPGGRLGFPSLTYNSAALYSSDFVSFYDKVHLVPFGEYIPGDKIFPRLQKLAPVGSCTPGELKLLTLGDVRLGVAICYEDTDSAQIRRLAQLGADVLVFITNDSWFSFSDETVQHAWQSVARAIETGLPVVRVGNSGVTGTILPNGKASWLVDGDGSILVDAQGTMFDRISIPETVGGTPYTKFGDIPLFVLFLLLTGGIFLVKYKDYYEKRRYLSM